MYFSMARQFSWADVSTVQTAEESGSAAAADLVCIVLTLQECLVFTGWSQECFVFTGWI
jgi:hypothetical protein